jgi:phosphopantothenoylcysteine decarboxylase / phosphopantothenate---cysteine ligase
LYSRGADVTLVIGPSSINLPANGMTIKKVNTAEEMYNACTTAFEKADIGIMAAAVADYSPVIVADKKIKKDNSKVVVEMKKTKDILKRMGEMKKKSQVLVGFALETTNEKEYALGKLKSKNADMIVLNSLNDPGAGFGTDTNKITIFDKSGRDFNFGLLSKKETAKNIVDTIIQLYYV